MEQAVVVKLRGITASHCTSGDARCPFLTSTLPIGRVAAKKVWGTDYACTLFNDNGDARLWGDPPRRCKQCKEAEQT